MKFLIATPLTASQSGGPAQYTVCLKIALTKQGHSVEIISFQDVAQYPSGIRHFMLLMKVWARLRSIDTVIALDTVSVALPVVIAARLTRTKCIVRIGGDFLWEQYVERTKEKILLSEFYIKQPSLNFKEYFVLWLQKNIVLRMADLLVFSTSWQLKIWSKPYALTKRRTVIIENAYPSNYTPEVIDRSKFHTILWIGRDITLKNVDVLDAAIKKVKETYPSLSYEKYSSLAHDEVMRILDTCRLLVIPSISEVSPNIALEALSLHVPIILTKDCGLHEMLQDTAVWVDSNNVTDLSFQISALMDDETYKAVHARVCRFKSDRSYDDIADDFLSHMHTV